MLYIFLSIFMIGILMYFIGKFFDPDQVGQLVGKAIGIILLLIVLFVTAYD